MLLASIKSASSTRLFFIKCRRNNFSLKCLSILYNLGYIRGFSLLGKYHVIVHLRYNSKGGSVIRQLNLISKPSRQIYSSYRSLKGARLNNFIYSNSFVICSTPIGLFTDTESTLLKHGGELVLYIS